MRRDRRLPHAPRCDAILVPQGYCEIAVREGRIWYDNEPQRQLDQEGARHALAKAYRLTDRAQAGRARLDATRPKDRAWTLADYEAEWKVQDMDNGATSLKLLAINWYKRPMRPLLAKSVFCASVALALGIIPASWLAFMYFRARRRRLRIEGHICTSCGYDLRATRERCPECGTVVATGATA